MDDADVDMSAASTIGHDDKDDKVNGGTSTTTAPDPTQSPSVELVAGATDAITESKDELDNELDYPPFPELHPPLEYTFYNTDYSNPSNSNLLLSSSGSGASASTSVPARPTPITAASGSNVNSRGCAITPPNNVSGTFGLSSPEPPVFDLNPWKLGGWGDEPDY
jgi:hypothetical protein